MSNLISISIVMTYYDRLSQLRNTLKSFDIHKYTNFEVIIVDDGSQNEPINNNTFSNFNFPITVINMPVIKNYMNSCIPFNEGLKKANGDIIIIQNAECLHMTNILDYVRKNLKESNYLSFSCYSLNQRKTLELIKHSEWSIEYLKNLLTNNTKAITAGDDAWYNHSKFNPCGFHFTSAIMRKNLEKLHGFDERFYEGVGYDDQEILTRIKKMSLDVEIIDTETVIHQWHYSIIKPSNYLKLAAKNELLYHFVTKREKQYSPGKKSIQYKVYRTLRPFLVSQYLYLIKFLKL